MIKNLYLIVSILIVTKSLAQNPDGLVKQFDIIAFGSCNRHDKDQKMWRNIRQNDPDLFIWLGDIIYGDTYDMGDLKSKYSKQKNNADYANFINQVPVIGIWDDHDYGINDGGKEYPRKNESKAILMDFLDIPGNDDVYAHEGAYNSFDYAEGKVKVILLDARYFRDPLVLAEDNGPYTANPEGDILGEQQWKWFEKVLFNSNAEINIIGCGIQFLPEEHGWEKWSNFPKAKKRLLGLLSKINPKRPLLLSGDRHIAEFSKVELEGMNYPIYEFTSSGLTHTWSKAGKEPNRYRVGKMVINRNFGIIKIDWINDKVALQSRGLKNELFQEIVIDY